MEPTADELAGVVDLFDALTRAELRDALSELAFKRDEQVAGADAAIDAAIEEYHLVPVDGAAVSVPEGEAADGDLLAVGPAAFPDLPEGAADLPHIMSVPDRRVDRAALAAAVEARFREEAVLAARSGEGVDRLLDLSYELDVWGDVDVTGARERLREAADDQ